MNALKMMRWINLQRSAVGIYAFLQLLLRAEPAQQCR